MQFAAAMRCTHKAQALTYHIFLQTSQSSPNHAKQHATGNAVVMHNVACYGEALFLHKITVTFLQISRKPQLIS